MNRTGKPYAIALAALLLALLLAGCMNAGNRSDDNLDAPEATGTPYVGTDPAGVTTPAPTATSLVPGLDDAKRAIENAFDWKTNVGEVQDRINQFSEVAASYVVVNGPTALVGVEFDPQYRGEMTERIRQMIAGVVMSYDAQVQTVAVTAETEDVKTVRSLAERAANGADEAELKTEMDKIVRNTTTLS